VPASQDGCHICVCKRASIDAKHCEPVLVSRRSSDLSAGHGPDQTFTNPEKGSDGIRYIQQTLGVFKYCAAAQRNRVSRAVTIAICATLSGCPARIGIERRMPVVGHYGVTQRAICNVLALRLLLGERAGVRPFDQLRIVVISDVRLLSDVTCPHCGFGGIGQASLDWQDLIWLLLLRVPFRCHRCRLTFRDWAWKV
jgi:hypothetical protein